MAGLGFDIIGASILVVADMPTWREAFSSYCPVLRDGEIAKKRLTTSLDGDEVFLNQDSPGYEEVIDIIEKRRQKISGDIRSYRLEDGPFLIIAQGKGLRRPLYSDDLSSWVAEWEAKYIRRLGLGVLVLGFIIQLIATGV